MLPDLFIHLAFVVVVVLRLLIYCDHCLPVEDFLDLLLSLHSLLVSFLLVHLDQVLEAVEGANVLFLLNPPLMQLVKQLYLIFIDNALFLFPLLLLEHSLSLPIILCFEMHLVDGEHVVLMLAHYLTLTLAERIPQLLLTQHLLVLHLIHGFTLFRQVLQLLVFKVLQKLQFLQSLLLFLTELKHSLLL